jgi:uncharacterized membrane protein
MSTIGEIEEAIARLPPAEFRTLLQRLRERNTEEWDRQIEEDARSGRVDALYTRLMEEGGEQPKVPLAEVLDDPRLS